MVADAAPTDATEVAGVADTTEDVVMQALEADRDASMDQGCRHWRRTRMPTRTETMLRWCRGVFYPVCKDPV